MYEKEHKLFASSYKKEIFIFFPGMEKSLPGEIQLLVYDSMIALMQHNTCARKKKKKY